MPFIVCWIIAYLVVSVLRLLFPKDSAPRRTEGTGHVWRSSGDDPPRSGSRSGSCGGGDRTSKSQDEKSKTDALYR